VFLLAFIGAYWIRLQNPDLWHPYNGGEKPMDLAYFTAVTKTTDMSQGPIDPWNAGGYLNYYYYGQFISATVTKLLGIVPEVAYNLVVPMFFALAASATFSLTYNLTESTRRLMRRRPGRLPISAKGPIIAGLVAIFFVLIAGNLRAVDVLEQQLTKQSDWHSSIPLLGGVLAIAGGLKEAVFSGGFRDMALRYDWWAPSRALSARPQEVAPITEFPFWTFLFADLHAHLMAIPFAMTFAGVALGVVMNFSRLNPAGSREQSRARELSSWAIVVVLGMIVGALRWINSWDYPPFLLLGAAALLIAERAKYGSFSPKALAIGVLKIIVMGAVSYEAFAPFAKNYSQAYNGFHQSDQTTALGDYLSHFGILLFFISGFLLFALNRSMTRSGFVRGIFFGRSRRRNPAETAAAMATFVIGAAVIIWLAAMHDYGVVGLAAAGLVAVVLISIRELRSPSPMAPVLLFVYAMIALGLGLCGGVELLTLDGDIGRMNTVFKFYLHVWMVWGVVAAFGLWYLFAVMQPQATFLRRAGSLNAALVRVPRYAFATVVVMMLALAMVYPYFGTRARLHDRFNPSQGTGNDGLAFLDKAPPYQNLNGDTHQGGEHNLAYTRDGINWIRANIKGSPTTMEAVGASYRSMGSRVSIYTGLPTVTGWDFHQIQQRGKFAPFVQKRQADVKEFYSTADVIRAREILRTYDVEWVIVGDEERFNYPAAGMLKFQDGLSGFLEKVYENPGMQVWHVIPQDQLRTTASVQAAP
jgi:YYY domain-containing protein